MTLSSMMTASATTKRLPAISSGKRGAPTTYLESVRITPVMLSNTTGQHQIRQAIGVEAPVQVFEAYTESHTHSKNSSSVTELPDIVAGDQLVTGGTTYGVRWCEQQPATSSFGATLLIYLTEDK